jgi:hypothetical protein
MRDGIRALHSKYVEIRRLRLEQEHGSAADPRPALTRLARDFPGALRELDALPFEVIEARLSELNRAVDDPVCVEPWMRAQVEYHALTRGALAAKRFLSEQTAIDESMGRDLIRARFAERARDTDAPEELLAWADDLESIANPPSGKITAAVFTKLAARLGVSLALARALVLPLPSEGVG